MNVIIGRKKEIELLEKISASKKSEFVAVYGRRRVGKTFLIREFYQYEFDFQLTGLANADTNQQLFNFQKTFQRHSNKYSYTQPRNWLIAFQDLIRHLEGIKEKRKKIIFFDELPWLSTAKSDFMLALENFWNGWATNRKDIILIACGSAASWMINELIKNTGGLHNRVTQRMKIAPFNLAETELMLRSRRNVLDKYQIVQIYMVTGGIPFYLENISPEKSAPQNIEDLCFLPNSLLKNEFKTLFASLFKKHEKHELIIAALASKQKGLTRNELLKITKLPSGGRFTKLLEELEESGFVSRHTFFGAKVKNILYRLSDFYSLFYFRFIKDNTNAEPGAWINAIDHPAYRAWSGYAFEQVVMTHLAQVKKALSIQGVWSQAFSWRSNEKNAAQIDLIIDRRDHVINVCEIKFSMHPFRITKTYAAQLRNKIGVLKNDTKTRKAVFLTMITTFGLEPNEYANSIVQNKVSLVDLFK